MKIELSVEEANQLITTALAYQFPEVIIEDFTYSDWQGLIVNARPKNSVFTRKTTEPDLIEELPSLPPLSRTNDSTPDDIPF